MPTYKKIKVDVVNDNIKTVGDLGICAYNRIKRHAGGCNARRFLIEFNKCDTIDKSIELVKKSVTVINLDKLEASHEIIPC